MSYPRAIGGRRVRRAQRTGRSDGPLTLRLLRTRDRARAPDERPGRGKAEIYLDNKLVGTIDTYAAKTSVRQAVCSASVSLKSHTITVRVLGTVGRPRFDIDGIEFYSPHTSAPSVSATIVGEPYTRSRTVTIALSAADGRASSLRETCQGAGGDES